MNYTIGGIGYVLVECETRYENKTGYFGVDNKELIVDTRYEPLKYAVTKGKVLQVPYALGEMMLSQIGVGFPPPGIRRGNKPGDAHAALYAIGGYYQYKRLSDIEPEVKIGDTIWFMRGVFKKDENIVDEFERDGSKVFIFKVDYDLIICIDKEEGPHMIGARCFVEPMYESWDKFLVPTFFEQLGPNGEKLPKPQNQWMVTAMQPQQSKLKGILRHFGTPLKGDTFEFEKNAEVYLRRNPQWKYNYKGTDYMLVYQWDIFAEVVKDEQ